MKLQDYYTNIGYLGDSVFIGRDNYDKLWIFTYNGIKPENEICLEEDVLDNFLRFIQKHD